MVAEDAVEKARTLHGMESAEAYIKGIGIWREQAIRGIISKWIELTSIFDVTPIPHNGCRKKKVRKL
jgi:small subunit ribosomal protein S11